ncbi:MAG: glycosyltransferase family 2 protein [Deltaproteobacteria bacterium]|nr:glycosyltransferase family 2 protein [Deltaproteobacteria bacterium]
MDASTALTALYLVILVALAIYGFHRSSLVFLYYRHRDKQPAEHGRFAELPAVTVQLPLFNEMYVVERLLEAVAAIRYPRDRFQIQVLDDSTDETRDICRRKIDELVRRCPVLDIEYVHRLDRTGFKAGALENGLRTAKGELLLIFDADFVPNPDILERTVHHFLDPRVAVVQCRWEHINRDFSALTEAQALMLNGHFIMEHAGRNRSGRFFNFNGTAGLWRRSAIVDAGGWHHDTLTEDMDLSYRAQLRGWRFVYLPHIATPAELPVEMSAFKAQQFRWAKGSIQVARKLLPRIFRSHVTFAQKVEAFFHLTNNFAYPLLLLLSLLLLPNLVLRTSHGVREVLLIDLPLFFGTTLSIASFYLASEREVARLSGDGARSPWGTVVQLPLVLSLGIGLCVNQTRAVIEAVFGRETEFVRTPKHGIRGKLESWSGKKYRAAKSLTPLFEMLMAGYFVVAVRLALGNGHYLSVPFLLLFLFGFGYVGAVSTWQGGFGQAVRRLWRRTEDAVAPASVLPGSLIAAAPDATPCPILLPAEPPVRGRARARGENAPREHVAV